jgi:hypothetical protein
MTATGMTRFEKNADNFIETVLRDRPIMIYDIVSEVEEYIATIDDFKENNSKMLLDYFKNKTNQEEINNEIMNALNYSDKQLEEANNISPEDNNYNMDADAPDLVLIEYIGSIPDPIIYELIQLIVRSNKVRIRTMHELVEAGLDDPFIPDKWIYHKDWRLDEVLDYIRKELDWYRQK